MSTSTRKIAVFGSAFNPPTLGHLSVISRLSHFDTVLLVPSIAHPWGKQMLDFDARCELVELFLQDIELNNVQLSRVEEEIFDGSHPVTTFKLLNYIQDTMKGADISFVVGPDNFFNFSKFAHADEIVERWSVLACPQTVDVRSTQIREKLQKGELIDDLTTNSVKNQLLDKQFYYRMGVDKSR